MKPGSGVLVACSGGPDSVALATNLARLERELGFRFHLGHVNHKLRGTASDTDARFVMRLAGELGWSFHLWVRRVKPGVGGNLEEKLRFIRYAALREMARRYRCSVVLTAHTADDQAETVFMNLLRGAGPSGLAGMSPVRLIEKESDILLARPFFAVTKNEIQEDLRHSRTSFRQDASNQNQKFLRNWLRRSILPRLEERVPGFRNRLVNLANLFRDEELYWADETRRISAVLFTPDSRGWLLDFKKVLSYPRSVQRRLFRSVIGENILTFDGMERLMRWMQAPPSNGRRWLLKNGWIVERLSKSKGSPSSSIFWLGRRKRPGAPGSKRSKGNIIG